MLTDFQILHHGPGQEDAAWPYECQLYFGREIEKDVRAEVEPLVRHLLSAHDDQNSTLRDDRVTHAADQLRTWLNKEATHGAQA